MEASTDDTTGNQHDIQTTVNCQEWKHIYDNVHGNIYVDPICLKFIDTQQFQRLRDLKQLGLTHMVYPGAVHSRFEHSLGVYWLANKAVSTLKGYQAELEIDDYDIQTVKLAGLLHDIGHGPFSHTFERAFLPKVLDGYECQWSYEDMSVKMIDYIVDQNNINIDTEMKKKVQASEHHYQITEIPLDDRKMQFLQNLINMVKAMIVSSSADPGNSVKGKRFLYDIVANGRNGIDVDKFDYIVRDSRACGLGCNFQFDRLVETMRVIGDEICYPAKEYLTVHKLFVARADLHRTVYTHAKVKAIELMCVDALLKATSYMHLEDTIFEPDQFSKLDDSLLKEIEFSTVEDLKEARDLILRIRRRDLNQFCNEFSVPKDQQEHFKPVTAKDIICSQKAGCVNLQEDDVAVTNIVIDMTRGRNILHSLRFYMDYKSMEKFPIPDDRISHLLPTYCRDVIVRVYSKKAKLVGAVSEAFENFQLKTYGRTAQVHATPEKKKLKT